MHRSQAAGGGGGGTYALLPGSGGEPACAAHAFAAHVDYPAGAYPSAVAAVDLNGDGKPDLVVTNFGYQPDGTGSTVSVLINRGDGTFAPKVDYPTGLSPLSVAAADLNGDGKPDLAVTNVGGNSVSVLLNHGDGTFAPKVDYPAGGCNCPSSVTPVDLDGDGKPDLVITNSGCFGDDPGYTVGVFLNQGDGTFGAQTDYRTGQAPDAAAVADLNGDGKPDLAVASTDSVSVLISRGDGTLAAHVDYPTGGYGSIVSVDLDGDGVPDIAISPMSLLFNQGDGTFAPHVDYTSRGYPQAIAAADLNGDGHPDLVTANGWTDQTVTVRFNHGDGTLTPEVDYPTGSGSVSVVAVDLNGDGRPDLATANQNDNTVSVLLNTCTP